MELTLHPDFKVTELTIGAEKAPLLVVDNFINNAEILIDDAVNTDFTLEDGFYPGMRAKAPLAFQKLLLEKLETKLLTFFDINAQALAFSICHYSIVTKPPKSLKLLQRIPHFDSPKKDSIAAVYYLFKKNLGGTSFYRHKKTNFEYINENRQFEYFSSLESENGTNNIPQSGYINGDTPLFDRIAEQEGIFNRIIFYRRNSLHSGSINENFSFDKSPLTGRLSIASFIDPQPLIK